MSTFGSPDTQEIRGNLKLLIDPANKPLLFIKESKMKFIVHTKYGTFHSKSVGATEEDYQEAQKLIMITLQDWDEFVVSVYGKPYMFQQQNGFREKGTYSLTVPDKWAYDNRGTTEIPFEVNGKEMGVSFETWLDTSPEDTAKHFAWDWENDTFWERNFYPDVRMIANDLHSKGLIEPGKYIIEIDW